MSLNIHYYLNSGVRIIELEVDEDIEKFFKENNIKVSTEVLNGEIILYGCPYSDVSEESEVIMFVGNKNRNEALKELLESCKKFISK